MLSLFSGGDDEVPGTRPERLTLLLETLASRVVVPRYAAMTSAFSGLDEAAQSWAARGVPFWPVLALAAP